MGLAEVAGEADDVAVRFGLDFGDSLLDALLRPAVDDHLGAFARQTRGDGEADAGGAAGDDRAFALELKIYGESSR